MRPLVMGIVNVTPDSFYPASRAEGAGEALERGRAMAAAGCDVLDVGGESTRPGAEPVGLTEELDRVLPAVAGLAQVGRVSIDTTKAEVARQAVAAGATMLNDVSGTLAGLAGELGVAYVGMHRQGDSATMQVNPTYGDVVGEVEAFLVGLAAEARSAGVDELWLDPGIGFGKTVAHNLALLASLDRLAGTAHQLGAGVLVGASRKRFLGLLGPVELSVEERLEGTIATGAWAALHGADMVRVHDVEAAVYVRDLVSRDYPGVAA